MGKLKNIIQFGCAALIFAGGVFGIYKLEDRNIDNANETPETLVVYNTKNEIDTENNKHTEEKVAYMIVDYYLYQGKNIKVTTLTDGSDFEMSGGLYVRSDTSYSSLIKEISKYNDGGFVAVEPASEEYTNIKNLREELATSLIEKTAFNDASNQEKVDFANFITDNMDLTEKKWGAEETAGMILGTLLSAVVAGAYVLASEYVDSSRYY